MAPKVDSRREEVRKTKVTIKKKLLYEIVVMSATIGLAWMLLLLPIIFYHLPDEVFLKMLADGVVPNNISTMEAVAYRTENVSSINPVSAGLLNINNPNLHHNCQNGFFRPEELGVCVPNCHTWSQASHSVTIGADVAIAMSAIIGLLTGLAVIAISLFRFKKIFTFPSIFIVYMTCDVLVIGILYAYILLQLVFWWFFHTTALLWKIMFPLHARSFDTSGKTKYVHIACVIVGAVIPLLPVTVLMADFAHAVHSNEDLQAANVTFVSGGLGFGLTQFPPLLCFGRSDSVNYYGILLPIILMFFVGIPELILLFVLVHRQHGLFTNRKSFTSHLKLGTPERKILIAFCYYVLLMILSLPSFMLRTRLSKLFGKYLYMYFACEEEGVDPNSPGRCDDFRDIIHVFGFSKLSIVAYVLNNLLPIVFLVYSVNFEEVRAKLMKFKAKKKGQSHEMQTIAKVETVSSTLEAL